MRERKWVEEVLKNLTISSTNKASNILVEAHKKLPYGYEIRNYGNNNDSSISKYETDLLVSEKINEDKWKPRIVIEAKMGRINTHSAIAYSKKAQSHKSVHPYLRYGVVLANRKHYPLPGRLYKHGENFDFMFSFKGIKPTEKEQASFSDLINYEIKASQNLEHILYDSRKLNREKYTMLHRKLELG